MYISSTIRHTQDCLDLIEGRPNGILAMLDDECKINGTGKSGDRYVIY